MCARLGAALALVLLSASASAQVAPAKPAAAAGMPAGMPQMMAIRADRTTAKAGIVRFEMTNWSSTNQHEVLVVPLNAAGEKLAVVQATRAHG